MILQWHIAYGDLIAMPTLRRFLRPCLVQLSSTKKRPAANILDEYAFDQSVDFLKADQTLANAEALISEWQLLSPDLKQQFAQLLLLRVMPNPR